MMFETLDEKFDVAHEALPESVSVVLAPDETKSDIDADQDLARRTMHEIIRKGNMALDGILNIAQQSEHPRAYEVAGQILKNMSEISKDLMTPHKVRKDIDKISGKGQTMNVKNQNVFVGSTKDVLQAMKSKTILIPDVIIEDAEVVE
jgi:hypothetical protein